VKQRKEIEPMADPRAYKKTVIPPRKGLLSKEKGKILRVNQVKDLLNCSRTHVYNLIDCGKLKAFRIGDRKGIRIYEAEVAKIIEEWEEADF
jgi:excisionase family DNA binding protein